MGCIEIFLFLASIAAGKMINRNMGCIEIVFDYIGSNLMFVINRNMGCIEMLQKPCHCNHSRDKP